MEKYNKFIRNIAELIEKGLITSTDFKKEMEDVFKFKIDNIVNRLNLISREEFEIQKKRIEKLEKSFNQFKTTKKKGGRNKKTIKAKRL